ncbi:hypothetical protein N9095_00070 [bacterium]|nr:hypothetical protein [bacterium]
MLLKLSLSGFRIYGNTFPHKDIFKSQRLRWDPQDKCWYGKNFEAVPLLKRYIPSIVINTPFFKPKVPGPDSHTTQSKQYKTKVETERRRVAALKGLEGIPEDLCQSIVSRALPKFYGCTCSGTRTCANCHYACCDKAVGVFCVCSWATECSRHGRRCNGSHD